MKKGNGFLVTMVLVLLLLLPSFVLGEEITLTGVGNGHNGSIVVEVVVDNDAIQSITVVEQNETAGISDSALTTIPDAIVAKGGVDGVDAVSGATDTSNGIFDAVKNALAPSEEKIESTADTTSGHNDFSVDTITDWDEYAPKIKTLENGVRVQKTPDSANPFGWFSNTAITKSYNSYYLHADQRGCNSCHNLQDCMKAIGHSAFLGEYEAEQMPYQNCIACHSSSGSVVVNTVRDAIHGLHSGSSSFNAMGGTCQSCHYIDADGNYLRWDFVKYDVMSGMTSLSADTVNAKISWNQDQLTDEEERFIVYRGRIRGFEFGYTFDLVEAFREDNIYDTYNVLFQGDMDNPCTMTINEMIEKCGSVTDTICAQCSINGNGGSLIYQVEVKGIPISELVKYLGVHEDADMFCALSFDNYCTPLPLSAVLANNGLLIYEMNGQPLSDAQGYPIAFWAENYSCGNFTRYLSSITITHSDGTGYYEVYNDYIDPATGYLVSKPNIGVLTAESGQIFAPGATVHLEGYAFANNEPITKIEFSFDRGATWIEVQTENTVSKQWVYWKMDVDDLPEGAYLLCMRATSLKADGELRVNEEIPKFLINVKE